MTTTPTAPDAALLWAREFIQRKQAGEHIAAMAARGDLDHELRGVAKAFRAGQSHADAGLLAALEASLKLIEAIQQSPANVWHVVAGDPETLVGDAHCAVSAAIAAAKGA